MYKTGTYVVTWDDYRGEFHRGPIFDDENNAREFANRIWTHHDVVGVGIVKCIYTKNKRRHTVDSAHKIEGVQ